MGAVLVGFGILAIAGAFLGKGFYSADPIALAEFRQKSSRWSGRLIFFVVGIGLIGIGVILLMGSR